MGAEESDFLRLGLPLLCAMLTQDFVTWEKGRDSEAQDRAPWKLSVWTEGAGWTKSSFAKEAKDHWLQRSPQLQPEGAERGPLPIPEDFGASSSAPWTTAARGAQPPTRPVHAWL